MKLGSRSDVITNSSTEVFIFPGIKDISRFRREIKEITDAPISEPWRFDWTDKEDYDSFGMNYHFIDTTDPDEARVALSKMLEDDLKKYSKSIRFSSELSEYHKLFKKFRKSGLSADEFLNKYTPLEIQRYWTIGEPLSFYHLDGCVICGLGECDYIPWEDIDKILGKYKNSEHIRLG